MKVHSLRICLFTVTIVACTLIVSQFPATAQERYPTRPVTVWIGFPPGGSVDITIRALADEAEKSLGQKFVVVNKPGGGGSVAASLLAKEKPDGYTLLGVTDTPVTRAPHLMDLNYDPFQDLSYIVRVGLLGTAFVVRADSPFKKWGELVDWAKKNPGQLVFGHTGVGTCPHIGFCKLALTEGFTFKTVPFAGDVPTVTALLGGHVMVAGGSGMAWPSYVAAGTVRILIADEKLEYAPYAPSFQEMGYRFEIPSAAIVCAPKKIPTPIKDNLAKAFTDGIKKDSFRAIAKSQNLILTEPLTGQALSDHLSKSSLSFMQLFKEAGIYKIQVKK